MVSKVFAHDTLVASPSGLQHDSESQHKAHPGGKLRTSWWPGTQKEEQRQRQKAIANILLLTSTVDTYQILYERKPLR